MSGAARRVFVSGSTAGIGFGIARHFAREGARVCVHGRTAARVDEAIARLRAEVPDADLVACPGELRTAEEADAVAALAGDIDILVNNAGAYEPSLLTESSDEHWQKLWDVNVMSGVRLSRAFAPGMEARGWGRVVFISSESALQPVGDMVAYGATKAAQLALTRGLAESMTRSGVTVNVVLPGPTATEGVRELMSGQAERSGLSIDEVEAQYIDTQYPQSLIGRLATVDEVAAVVGFLASEAAGAVSGSAYRVDGGVMRAIV